MSIDIEELKRNLKECQSMIGSMCAEGRPPKMSIPARPHYDEDIFICETIKRAVARLEAAENEREQLNEQLRKMGADWLATAINGMAESLPAARIRSLVEQHGSYRKVGELLGVDHAYLHRIVSGEKDNMSDELLKKIGLRRGTFYTAFDKVTARGEQ